jgi:ligand-binding sensor domain-containing protein/class 3 adenylate cyclase
MRNCINYILFALALILCFNFSQAQRRNIKFDNITIDQGISQSSVNAILQDDDGFIWIATQDGLNKYDGYQFTIFKSNPSDASSLSTNFVQTLCEDKDGYIWVGTEGGGLNRFDKYTHTFKRFDFGESNRFVTCIAEDSEGFLWFGTNNGNLNRLDKKTGVIQKYGSQLKTISVQNIYNDSDGNLWVATGNGLFLFDKKTKTFKCFKKENKKNSLPDDFIWSITEDNEKNLWIGTNNGLCRMVNSGDMYFFENYFHSNGNEFSLADNAIRSVFVSKDNILHAGTAGNGLSKMDLNNPIEFYNYSHSEYISSSLIDNQVQCIFEDKSGLIWIGTNNGVSKYDPLKQFFDHIRHKIDDPNSLNDKTVWSITEDANGIVWIGTREGINAVDRKRNKYYRFAYKSNNPNVLNNNSVLGLFFDSEGTLWAGATDGLYKIQVAADYSSAKFISVPYRRALNAFSDTRVYKIAEDRDGFLWIAAKEGLSRLNKETGEFNFYQNIPSDNTSLPSNQVRNVFCDSKGNIWVCTDAGGLTKVVVNDDKVLFRTYRNRLQGNMTGNDATMIISVWEENNGTFWLGSYGGGLMKFEVKGERFESFTEEDGLPNNVVYGVLGDNSGNLWLSTNHGLACFNIKTQEFQNYLAKDGVQSNEFNVGAYYKSLSGELFFGGIDGVNTFFASDIRKNLFPPAMAITELLLQNKPLLIGQYGILTQHISATKEITLSHKQNNITIRFSALHFSNPENIQYKFIMEGNDEAFSYLNGVHEAHYTNLSPGTYTFKVYGRNSDGVWSEKPATLVIHITPPFWATWWFRTIAVVLLLLLGFGFNQARIWRIKRSRLHLAKEVRERTREVILQKEQIEEQKALIETEKNKVEKLLLNILPEETAEELKSKGKASARSYRQVTIMFTDFVGFTKIAETMRPADLVTKLDSYFIAFDDIVAKYNIEKIKTIGDAYMCAAGVPIRSKSNPIDTTLAALHIQRYMKEQHENEPGQHWELRIGINTGEIIAGVVGTKRFAYDIWGNAVNVAQRMEMSSEAFKVNVSGATFQEIEPYFEFTYRGKVAAKNKGEVDMYYVERIKPELSIDGLGIEPNEKFWKYVDLYLYSSINYKKAERHIMKILHEKLPDNLYYHGIHHTYDVIQAAERLALMEGITDEQMFTLKSAATYHDAGFVEQYAKNEPVGIRMAQEILPKYGYTPEQVEEVAKLIRATIIPHDPQSHLEQIICDADLDYLGRDDFHPISDTLKYELRERGIIGGDRAWDELQVKFLNMHKYFTASAIKMRQAKKDKHLQDILNRLEENKYES